MIRKGSVSLFLGLCLGAASSCNWRNNSQPGPLEKKAPPAQLPEQPPVVDLATLKKQLAEHRGKVVLIDFWATFCVPCIKGLPAVAGLGKRFRNSGFSVLLVNRDLPEDWPKARLILAKKAPDLACVVLQDASRDAAIEYFGTNWRGELPARFLLDRSGKIAGEFLAESTEEDIERAIASLLKRPTEGKH